MTLNLLKATKKQSSGPNKNASTDAEVKKDCLTKLLKMLKTMRRHWRMLKRNSKKLLELVLLKTALMLITTVEVLGLTLVESISHIKGSMRMMSATLMVVIITILLKSSQKVKKAQ